MLIFSKWRIDCFLRVVKERPYTDFVLSVLIVFIALPGEAKANPPRRYSKRRVHVTWEADWGDGEEDEIESSVAGAAEPPPLGNDQYEETFYTAAPETGSAESQQVSCFSARGLVRTSV